MTCVLPRAGSFRAGVPLGRQVSTDHGGIYGFRHGHAIHTRVTAEAPDGAALPLLFDMKVKGIAWDDRLTEPR